MFAVPTVRDTRVAAALWVFLVTLGVVGRLWQPTWNVTPLAGIALVAGAAFANPLLAATVPLVSLWIGNLCLQSSPNVTLGLVVYAATIWPVFLGPLVRRGKLTVLCGGALAHSLVFYLSTNFACWLLFEMYPKTAAGLTSCYVAALPFYRWMPLGDVVWAVAVAAGVSLVLCRLDRSAAGARGESKSLATGS
jgi:hypothetical protein